MKNILTAALLMKQSVRHELAGQVADFFIRSVSVAEVPLFVEPRMKQCDCCLLPD